MSGMYDAARAAFLADLTWTGGDFMLCLVADGYLPDYAGHTVWADIPAQHRLIEPVPLANRRITADGFALADRLKFPTLTTTAPVRGLVVLDSRNDDPETWPLILFVDEGFGLGAAIHNEDSYVIWDQRGIFRL